jgi:hypothetical protein
VGLFCSHQAAPDAKVKPATVDAQMGHFFAIHHLKENQRQFTLQRTAMYSVRDFFARKEKQSQGTCVFL